jgi:hypothetical protein
MLCYSASVCLEIVWPNATIRPRLQLGSVPTRDEDQFCLPKVLRYSLFPASVEKADDEMAAGQIPRQRKVHARGGKEAAAICEHADESLK